jgi:uncharacterized membrane protein
MQSKFAGPTWLLLLLLLLLLLMLLLLLLEGVGRLLQAGVEGEGAATSTWRRLVGIERKWRV